MNVKKTSFRVKDYMGCCGTVDKKYKPWDEVWESSDYELYHCSKCGKTDFAEAFHKMELVNKVLFCPHCKLETKHELEYFDCFSGYGETTCTNCKKKVTHDSSLTIDDSEEF